MSKQSVTDRQWIRWAEQNPYRGVLRVDSFEMADLDTRRSFFASGEQHISEVLGLIDTHFGGLNARQSALDFGCGVGRMLDALAARFSCVVGVDVAPMMLQIARENTGAKNITFVSTLDPLAASNAQFDFVHSLIVLQHIRPRQGMPIIAKLFRLTKPGGCFALHFTVGDRRKLRRAMNWVRYHLPPAHWAYNLACLRRWNEPVTEMNRYDLFTVLDMANECGIDRVLVMPSDENGHAMVTIVGQRPASTH